jgi:hypothetical protein
MGTAQWLLLRDGGFVRTDTGKTFACNAAAKPGNYRLRLSDACTDTAGKTASPSDKTPSRLWWPCASVTTT